MSQKSLLVKNRDIIVFGGSGFLGKNLCKELKSYGANVTSLGSGEWDLAKEGYFDYTQFGYLFSDLEDGIVINLAADCGGIGYNKDNGIKLYKKNSDIIYRVFEICRKYKNKISKLINIGTVCSYPKVPPRIPFQEEDIWEGYPEETNAPYGIAKRSALMLSNLYKEAYGLDSINLMMANMYGEHDHFGDTAHVIPHMIQKMHVVKDTRGDEVVLWGSGKPTRDFLYVKDTVNIIIKVIEADYDSTSPVNVGTGIETPICMISYHIAKALNFKSDILWDGSKPDGQIRRVLDITKLKSIIGDYKFVDVENGLYKTVKWYEKSIAKEK
tara:strand:+ start:961 stop:1941 length:981 start_codon:yes stop_codon:yes gene_type:complete